MNNFIIKENYDYNFRIISEHDIFLQKYGLCKL